MNYESLAGIQASIFQFQHSLVHFFRVHCSKFFIPTVAPYINNFVKMILSVEALDCDLRVNKGVCRYVNYIIIFYLKGLFTPFQRGGSRGNNFFKLSPQIFSIQFAEVIISASVKNYQIILIFVHYADFFDHLKITAFKRFLRMIQKDLVTPNSS